MKPIETKEAYSHGISKGASVVLFSADWCPDCRIIEPVLPEIEQKYSNVTFLYADRDQLIDLCQELDVFGIPSFIFYNDGVEIKRFVSRDRKTKEEIEAFIADAISQIS
ncbi:thioredoxin family protein [Bacillus alkalicellulosilyticus]|uniref:thioredoxin family protein n=1 Tax=Alkalihalobacterium alkalicellulosilyticum TaxID=1912214 RepID=UPI000996A95C|nr:thioredoxin family protein [Bacillus alkalicellulosilyticus]